MDNIRRKVSVQCGDYLMTITGMIFEIQHACLHDEPGVRTAVFLKGCPLRCIWLHNPESQSKTVDISFQPETCTLCGAYINTCQPGAL